MQQGFLGEMLKLVLTGPPPPQNVQGNPIESTSFKLTLNYPDTLSLSTRNRINQTNSSEIALKELLHLVNNFNVSNYFLQGGQGWSATVGLLATEGMSPPCNSSLITAEHPSWQLNQDG